MTAPTTIETQHERLRRIGFQKGKSGNPKGKKKGAASLALALQKLLGKEPELLEAVARKLVEGAAAGDISACRLLFERLDGHKPTGFFNVSIDASDRRTAVSISPQVLSEISDARKRYEETKSCRPLPTT